MATLVVTHGPAEGQHFALEQHLIVMVGRDHQCTFQIVDPQMSRRHCQFKYNEAEGRHYAVDFESSNGVRVNGQRISEPRLLEDGDVVHIGGTLIIYSVQDSPDAKRISELSRKHGEGWCKTELDA